MISAIDERLEEERRQEGSTVDRDAVLMQLERLLEDHHFKLSRRFPIFLRYIVERTLAGEAHQLKERNIGTDVFGKGIDYDPALDSTVRVAAAEIRKRLALYYIEHQDELQLSLPIGSYVPVFSQAKPIGVSPTVPTPMEATETKELKGRWKIPMLAGVVGILLLAGLFISHALTRNALDRFWKPTLNANQHVLVLVAGHESSDLLIRDSVDPSKLTAFSDSFDTVAFNDLQPLLKVTGFLRSKNIPYQVRDEGKTTLSDLRAGPIVLVGAYCNSWTLRLLHPLRFHFANDASMSRYWIVDTQSKTPSRWVVDRATELGINGFRDYAIVGRFYYSDSGQMVTVVAGIGGGSNSVAGEVVTDPKFMSRILHTIPGATTKQNLEAVISTQIIDGQPGTPRIEAGYAW